MAPVFPSRAVAAGRVVTPEFRRGRDSLTVPSSGKALRFGVESRYDGSIMPRKTKVLFVCIGNSCRSQIAEALGRELAGDVMQSSSAGTAALGEIAQQTGEVLRERGIQLQGQFSKQLRQEDCEAADIIINMSGKPAETIFAANPAKVINWTVMDPYFADSEKYRQICDEIEAKIGELAESLRQKQAAVIDD